MGGGCRSRTRAPCRCRRLAADDIAAALFRVRTTTPALLPPLLLHSTSFVPHAPQVAGLKYVTVTSAQQILCLLEEGNRRRKQEATDANAVSSRSHAVLEIVVKRKPSNHYRAQQLTAKLSLVDLAGSERAAETNNVGHKLRDGANINRSLLALANCEWSCRNGVGLLCWFF